MNPAGRSMHVPDPMAPRPAVRDGTWPSLALDWHLAQIHEATGNRLQLTLSTTPSALPARCADGLLLQPAPGDTVVVAQVAGEWRVLMVLDRRAPATQAVLAVPQAASLRIQSPRLSLDSKELEVHARRTTASLGVVRFSAQALRLAAQRIAVWADSVHTRARAVAVRADMRVARIDGADVLKARQVLTEADDLVRLDARQIEAGATENVLIDGKRISLG